MFGSIPGIGAATVSDMSITVGVTSDRSGVKSVPCMLRVVTWGGLWHLRCDVQPPPSEPQPIAALLSRSDYVDASQDQAHTGSRHAVDCHTTTAETKCVCANQQVGW